MNFIIKVYYILYNNQINARALIGQSAVGYCYYKPTEKFFSCSTNIPRGLNQLINHRTLWSIF